MQWSHFRQQRCCSTVPSSQKPRLLHAGSTWVACSVHKDTQSRSAADTAAQPPHTARGTAGYLQQRPLPPRRRAPSQAASPHVPPTEPHSSASTPSPAVQLDEISPLTAYNSSRTAAEASAEEPACTLPAVDTLPSQTPHVVPLPADYVTRSPTATASSPEPASAVLLPVDLLQRQQPQHLPLLHQQHQQHQQPARALAARQLPRRLLHHDAHNSFQPLLVPWQHRGLMYQRARPWMKQMVMRLCTGLPPPACFIYQEMTPGVLQRVIQARVAFEGNMRQLTEELRWQYDRTLQWMEQASAGERPLPQQTLREAERELLNLKSAAGRTHRELEELRRKAEAYSDADYIAYSTEFLGMLREVQDFAGLLQQQYIPHLRKVAELQQRASRLVALLLDSDAAHLTRFWRRQHRDALAKLGLLEFPVGLQWQRWAWRYPPNEFVWVRPKGARNRQWSRPLRLPGEPVKLAKVRPHIRRLQSTTAAAAAAAAGPSQLWPQLHGQEGLAGQGQIPPELQPGTQALPGATGIGHIVHGHNSNGSGSRYHSSSSSRHGSAGASQHTSSNGVPPSSGAQAPDARPPGSGGVQHVGQRRQGLTPLQRGKRKQSKRIFD